jgi:hypothetical protein
MTESSTDGDLFQVVSAVTITGPDAQNILWLTFKAGEVSGMISINSHHRGRRRCALARNAKRSAGKSPARPSAAGKIVGLIRLLNLHAPALPCALFNAVWI